MKALKIILVIVVLFGVGGGIAYFLKKRSDKKEVKPNVPMPKTPIEPISTRPLLEDQSLEEKIRFDIEVPHIDTRNRRFDYQMHYGGIEHKGRYEEGGIKPQIVKKSFGSFVIKQELKQEGIQDAMLTKATAQKKRAVTTKGGATQISGMSDVIQQMPSNRSDWVNLFILDQEENILKQVRVNLSTGAKVGIAN